MGLFGSKKKGAAKKAAPAASKGDTTLARNIGSKILRPRITEKAMRVAEKNVYVFEIHQKATKTDVRDAIRTLYGVNPVAIRTVTQQPRRDTKRGRAVALPGLKKAYVALKEGDTITMA
jgi:large subunit ribosomal protein L23